MLSVIRFCRLSDFKMFFPSTPNPERNTTLMVSWCFGGAKREVEEAFADLVAAGQPDLTNANKVPERIMGKVKLPKSFTRF